MKKLLFALFVIAILSATFSSCKKYEDGPRISLATKKSRLCGSWKIQQYIFNGQDQTAYVAFFLGSFVWSIEKNGNYTQSGNASDAGTWVFGSGKDDAIFTSGTAGATPNTFHILRLKSKELWLKQTQANGDTEEFHLMQ